MPGPHETIELEAGRVEPLTRWFRRGDGGAVRLTEKELDLFLALQRRAPEPMSQADLLREVWGYRTTGSRTVESTVHRLRRKIERDARRPDHVVTAHGAGYRFVPKGVLGTNLPHPTTSFVGRGAELDAIAAAFAGGARLVTLHGPGGAGKTRLAIEHGRNAPGGRPVWLIDLATAATAEDLLQRVVRVLTPALAVGDDVGRALAARGKMLVVLDDLDDLAADAGPVIVRWLEAAPELQILATTRIALQVRAEHVVPVPPLPADDALTLFRERAGAARPAALLPDDADEEVARLLHRLDCLPFAIELCAAWVRTVPLDELAAMVERDPGPAALPAAVGFPLRHRSLSAVLEASWARLGPRAREALATLGVFREPFTFASACALLGADGQALLGQLVDHALLSLAGDRYRVAPPVREHVAATPEASVVRTAAVRGHLGWFGALDAESAFDRLDAPDGDRLRRAWSLEIDDRIAAMEAGLATQPALAVSAGFTALVGLQSGGSLRLARELGMRLLPEARGLWRALVLWQLGDVLGLGAEADRLRAAYEEARTLSDELGATRLATAATVLLAQLLRHQGEIGPAEQLAREALERARRTGDGPGEAAALGEIGRIHARTGAHGEAIHALHDARTILQSGGYVRREAMTRARIAVEQLAAGDAVAARTNLEEAIEAFKRLADHRSLAFARVDLGRVLHASGDSSLAVGEIERGIAIHRAIGNRLGECLGLTALGDARSAIDRARAEEAFYAGRSMARESGWPSIEERCVAGLEALGLTAR